MGVEESSQIAKQASRGNTASLRAPPQPFCKKMTIGVIFRCETPELPADADWKPSALGERLDVTDVVRRATNATGSPETTSHGDVVLFIVESEDSHLEVNIPASGEIEFLGIGGILGERAFEVIRDICRNLKARYYDSESGFIPL